MEILVSHMIRNDTTQLVKLVAMNTEYTNSRTAPSLQVTSHWKRGTSAPNAYVFGFAFLKA
jgi:hypothetical protein